MKGFDQILMCPQCGAFARLADRNEVNRGYAGKVYLCQNHPKCDSYVGCHPGTTKPLGSMAGRTLRRLRARAHESFDWHWNRGLMSRSDAYKKLATSLEIPVDKAHIGMLDEAQCEAVISIFSKRPWKTPKR